MGEAEQAGRSAVTLFACWPWTSHSRWCSPSPAWRQLQSVVERAELCRAPSLQPQPSCSALSPHPGSQCSALAFRSLSAVAGLGDLVLQPLLCMGRVRRLGGVGGGWVGLLLDMVPELREHDGRSKKDLCYKIESCNCNAFLSACASTLTGINSPYKEN